MNQESLNVTTNKKVIVLMLHLIALLIIFGAGFPILTIGSLMLSFVIIFFTNNITQLSNILFFLLPFASIFKINPEGNTFFNFLIFASILQILILNKNIKFTYKQIVGFLLFVIYAVIISGSAGIVSIIKLSLHSLFALLVFNQKDKINLRSLIVYFSIGIILASIAGFFSEYIEGLPAFMQTIELKLNPGEYALRFSGIELNPNHYTLNISIALSVWFVLLVNKITKKIDLLFIILLSVFGILSLSKSFLLSYMIILLISIIYYLINSPKDFLKKVPVIIGVVFVIYFFTGDETINILLSRFKINDAGNSDLANFTSGRSTIVKVYLKYIFKNTQVFLFGRGIAAENLLFDTHNFFIEMFYYLGIVGSILYVNLIKKILPKYNITSRKLLMNYLPLLILFFRGIGINMVLNNNLYFYYIIIGVTYLTNIPDIKLEKPKNV